MGAVLLVLGAGVATLVAVVVLAESGGAPARLPAALPDPGRLVGWGARLVRLAGVLAAAVTVGSLLVALGCGDEPVRRRATRGARRAALVWALVGAVGFVLRLCDSAGVPLSGLGLQQVTAGWGAAATMAPLVATGLAVMAALCARGSNAAPRHARWWSPSVAAVTALLLALLGSLVVPLAGHVATAEDAGTSSGGLVVHVTAALLWMGGLSGIVLHLRGEPTVLRVVLPRFSTLALCCYLALMGSGVLAATANLPFTAAPWQGAGSSSYATVLAGKVAVLVLLGAAGLLHRRTTLPQVLAGEPGAFWRLVGVELALLGAAAGLASALAQTPPPVTPTAHGSPVTPELSLTTLLLLWQPQALVLLAGVMVVASYLRAQRGCGAAGRAWPRRRSASFVAGVVLTVLATSSGMATYASLLLSVQLAQLLVLLLVVPTLLLLGRPVALLRLVHEGHLPLVAVGGVGTSALGALATCLLLTVLYRTPLVLLSLRSSWWHLLVLVGALVCGLLLLAPVLVEGDAARRSRAEGAAWLLPVVGCLTALAWQLWRGEELLAAAWFLELRLGWSVPAEDQRVAGVIAGAGGIGLGVVAALVLVRLQRQPGEPADHGGSSTRPRSADMGTAP